MRTKTPAFFLAGDSTTARVSIDGGGWGDGFLAIARRGGAEGRNFAVNGTTTVTFVTHGHWAELLETVQQHRDTHSVIVTIQFGHNDQKPTANISPGQFVANLEALIGQVRAAGGTPVLVSSLCRRNWTTSETSAEKEKENEGRIVRDLLDVTVGMKEAARRAQCHLVDLNQASMDYCACIGPAKAHSYNLYPYDTTHLNAEGGVVFGVLMAQLLCWQFPELGQYVQPDADVVRAINEGVYIWPDTGNGGQEAAAES
ncbi:hypothetical protein SCUCBS95973_006415 [Sporothrix curviconia]|uniref:SGNH hydrolase-type esterase domain-containing protein n=1 Tax=Sporothrix curviconia TaxID=1260050 RepID=A0ABP0C732_9PEZI